MTLLSICQDAADEMGLDNRPVSVVGNPDVDALRLLRFANRVGRDLAARAPWQALRVQRAFSAVAAEVQPAAIPSDFGRFDPETLWDRTNRISVSGPVGPAEYQSRRAQAGTGTLSGPARWFTRRGNDLLLWPPPTGGEAMAYEYQSAGFCASVGGVAQATWLADTDVGRVSEELITLGVIARFLEADGQPFQMANAAYERRLSQDIRNDAPASGVMTSGDMFGTRRHSTGEPGAADVSSSGGGTFVLNGSFLG